MIINMNGAKAPETPSPTLQEKTVTPETLPTVIGADEGYDGLSQVTVNPDAQLKAENIRSGKTIFGVEGAFTGEPVYSNTLDPAVIKYGFSNSIAYPFAFLAADFVPKGEPEPFEGSSRRVVLDNEYVFIGLQNGGVGAYRKPSSASAPHMSSSTYIPSYDWHHDTETYNGGYECYLAESPSDVIGSDNITHIKGSGWLCPVMLYYKYNSTNFVARGVGAVSDSAIVTGNVIPIDVDAALTVDSAGKHFTVELSSTELDVYGSFPSYISYYKVAAGFALVPNKMVIS